MGFLNSLFKGAGNFLGGINKGGGFGVGSNIANSIGGLFGGSKAQASPDPMSKFNFNLLQSPMSYAQQPQQQSGGGGGVLSSFLNPQQLAGQNQGYGLGPKGEPTGGGLNSLMSMFGGGKGLAGAGLTALGAFMPVDRNVPKSTASLDQLRAFSQQGGGPMSQLAQSKLTEQLNQNLQPMTEQEEAAIRRNYQMERDRRVKTIQDLYRNAQPGVDYLSNTNYQRDYQQAMDDIANQENTALAQGRRQIASDFNAQRAQQIAAASGIDTSNMQLMTQIASADLNQLMQQLQLNRDDAYYLKNLATQMGSGLMNEQPGFEQQLQLMAKYFPQGGLGV